jgi:hypothetical protein
MAYPKLDVDDLNKAIAQTSGYGGRSAGINDGCRTWQTFWLVLRMKSGFSRPKAWLLKLAIDLMQSYRRNGTSAICGASVCNDDWR